MPTSSLQRAQLLRDQLIAGGVAAVTDAAAAAPPCVIVPPPDRSYDLPVGWSATWRLICLAPGRGSDDAHDQLAQLVDVVVDVLDGLDLTVDRALAGAYRLHPDSDPLPAYTVTATEGIDP